MINELTKAVTEYQQKWQTLVAGRQDKAFFEALKPTCVAWKTSDLADYDAKMLELRDLCDYIFVVWMNERWIAKLRLKETVLPWNLRLIKLMQRRPGSTDAVGLDHIDFYTPSWEAIEPTLKKEPGLTWQYEKNNAEWYSVHFDAGEAKLRDHTICRVCADELMHMEQELLA